MTVSTTNCRERPRELRASTGSGKHDSVVGGRVLRESTLKDVEPTWGLLIGWLNAPVPPSSWGMIVEGCLAQSGRG